MEKDELTTPLKEKEKETPDGRPLAALDFNGEAKLQEERQHREAILHEFIPSLNSKAASISEEIQREIKGKLPPGADVTVEISFSAGSIGWTGLITILDVIGNIDAGINLSRILMSAIKFSINRVVRNRIEPQYPIKSINTSVRKRIDDPIHPITRFLWWCSGATPGILRDSPTEKNKYQGIGGAVLTTGVLACLSGGYALYTMFEGSKAPELFGIIFGPIWGLIIFNIDRYIVSTMKKEEGANRAVTFFRELWPAMPRLALAVVLGLTISKPLELQLFQSEIAARMEFNNDRLVAERSAELDALYNDQVTGLNAELTSINSAKTAKEGQVNALQKAYLEETDGTGGSGRYGYSVVAQKKQAEYTQADKELTKMISDYQPRVEYLTKELDGVGRRKGDILNAYRETLGKGFLARTKALSDLAAKENAIWRAEWGIILLLIFIELTPVLVKLLSPYGPYDAKLNLRHDAETREAEYRKNSVVNIASHHYECVTDAETKVDDTFFEESVRVRNGKVRSAWAQWDASNGHGSTFEEFFKSVKDKLYGLRNP